MSELKRDWMPELTDKGVKLHAVSIGTAEDGVTFVREQELPDGFVYADPDGSSYKALDMNASVWRLFFAKQTGLSFLKNGVSGFGEALKNYKPLMPKDKNLALQQGGTLVFRGSELVFSHIDEGTNAHAELSEVLEALGSGSRK